MRLCSQVYTAYKILNPVGFDADGDFSFCVFMIFYNIFCDVNRSALCLNISACNVFTDNTDTTELNSAQKQNKRYYGGIARNINTEGKFLNNNHKQIDDRQHRSDKTQHGCNSQRCSCKGENAFHCIFEELPE